MDLFELIPFLFKFRRLINLLFDFDIFEDLLVLMAVITVVRRIQRKRN